MAGMMPGHDHASANAPQLPVTKCQVADGSMREGTTMYHSHQEWHLWNQIVKCLGAFATRNTSSMNRTRIVCPSNIKTNNTETHHISTPLSLFMLKCWLPNRRFPSTPIISGLTTLGPNAVAQAKAGVRDPFQIIKGHMPL